MLTVSNITTYYGKVKILREVSLHIEQGEVIALLGGNGAGKTTTVKTISGLVKPALGEITFLGERINSLPPDIIAGRGIAHVPQGAGIFPSMTVLENLELGYGKKKKYKDYEKTLHNVCDRFPILGRRKKQLAGTLSGGERQILGIGRALMSNPKLCIFDEPSFGLSPIMVKEIATIIKNLSEAGTTVLLVEQNVRMALQVAGRGYVLDVGRIVLHEKASDLMTNEHVRKAYLGI